MGLTADAYARMIWGLMPGGRLWRIFGSLLSKVLLACADELARIDARAGDLLRESDPRTTTELLSDFERERGLSSAGGTIDERRARVVARVVARQRYRPADFRTALAALLAQRSDDVVIIERTHAAAAAAGDDREIFRFFAYRDPTAPGTAFLTSAQEQIDRMKPSHTRGHIIESINMLCDDPHSLCDRDLLGA